MSKHLLYLASILLHGLLFCAKDANAAMKNKKRKETRTNRKLHHFKLTNEEIRERLRLTEKDLQIADDTYELSLQLFWEEEKRGPALDSKSHNLAGIAGICLTLIFSGGGFLIQKLGGVLLPFWFRTFVSLYIGASFLSLVTLGIALCVSKPRSDYRALSDEDIFRKKEMKTEDNRYRRYLIAHFWKVYENNFFVNEKKANLLRWAYITFASSLIFLLTMVVIAGATAMWKGEKLCQGKKAQVEQSLKLRMNQVKELP